MIDDDPAIEKLRKLLEADTPQKRGIYAKVVARAIRDKNDRLKQLTAHGEQLENMRKNFELVKQVANFHGFVPPYVGGIPRWVNHQLTTLRELSVELERALKRPRAISKPRIERLRQLIRKAR